MSDFKNAPVARLGSQSIPVWELIDWLRYTERRAVVHAMLVDRLVLQQAAQRGWQVTVEELQQAVNSLRRTHKLFRAAEMHAWLAERRLSVEDLEKQMELHLLRERLLNEAVSTLDVDRHFAENRRDYDRARLARIVVVEEGLAEEIRLQLEEGADFSAMAERHSIDAVTRPVGGDLGIVSRTSLCPAVESVVFAARAGDVVGPVPTVEGFQLVRVQQLLIGELTPALANEIRRRLFDQWLSQQLRTVGFEIVLPTSAD